MSWEIRADRAARLETVEGQVSQLKSDISHLKFSISHHLERIKNLEASAHGFHVARSRFISTAKRDKFQNASLEDFRIIATGNAHVHGGNAEVDAGLYMNGDRTDFDAYEMLYGVHPGVALMIKYEPTLSLFSKHATYIASTRYTVTARFHECFSNFLAALKEAGYPSGYLDGNPTLVTAAYWNFLRCLTDEVQENSILW